MSQPLKVSLPGGTWHGLEAAARSGAHLPADLELVQLQFLGRGVALEECHSCVYSKIVLKSL